ncbi:MAG TPA: hypothetical protein VF623_06925, partial [Segetibacter sp.]
MKKILLAISFLVFLCSCQKELTFEPNLIEPGPIEEPVDTSLLVKSSFDRSGSTVKEYTYTYDSKGRIVSIVNPSGGFDRIIYTYAPNNTYTVDVTELNLLTAHETYILNSFHLVDSILTDNSKGEITSKKYIYNAGKQLVQLKEYKKTNSSFVLTNTTFFEYSNGNISKKYDTNNNQVLYE